MGKLQENKEEAFKNTETEGEKKEEGDDVQPVEEPCSGVPVDENETEETPQGSEEEAEQAQGEEGYRI